MPHRMSWRLIASLCICRFSWCSKRSPLCARGFSRKGFPRKKLCPVFLIFLCLLACWFLTMHKYNLFCGVLVKCMQCLCYICLDIIPTYDTLFRLFSTFYKGTWYGVLIFLHLSTNWRDINGHALLFSRNQGKIPWTKQEKSQWSSGRCVNRKKDECKRTKLGA